MHSHVNTACTGGRDGSCRLVTVERRAGSGTGHSRLLVSDKRVGRRGRNGTAGNLRLGRGVHTRVVLGSSLGTSENRSENLLVNLHSTVGSGVEQVSEEYKLEGEVLGNSPREDTAGERLEELDKTENDKVRQEGSGALIVS